MPRGQWLPIQNIYDIIQRNTTLDEEDCESEAPGSNSPRWQRNVRSVLQQRNRVGEIDWDGYDHYRLPTGANISEDQSFDPWAAPATFQVRSWSLHPDLPDLIGRKKVDWSCFESGTQIPIPFAQRFFATNREELPPGASHQCILVHDGQRFEAVLRNAGRTGPVSQVSIEFGRQLRLYIRELFSHSYDRISAERERRRAEGEQHIMVVLEDDEAEYIDFLETGRPYEYELRFLTRSLNATAEPDHLQRSIAAFMNAYVEAREGSRFRSDHPVASLLDEILKKISSVSAVREREYLRVVGSIGIGNWAYTPWIVIRDERLTDSVNRGIYIAIIFAADMSRFYVGLQQAVTPFRSRGQRQGTHLAMIMEADRLRQHPAFEDLEGFDTGWADLAVRRGVGVDYQHAFIYHRHFPRDQIPTTSEWNEILDNLLSRYQSYVESRVTGTDNSQETLQELLPALYQKVSATGFHYPRDDFEAFCIALKSKPFVILAGISGTGKTQLPIQIARAFGYEAEVIPVRPDWADSSDLLGYVDIHGRFQPGWFLQLCRQASEEPDKPVFVVLDEMNLARVEQYFAEVLSAIERRELVGGRTQTAPLLGVSIPSDEEEQTSWANVRWSDNLFLVGTVNMDETTHPFSRKVLDRAYTLEFRGIDLSYQVNRSNDNDTGPGSDIRLDWRVLRPKALQLRDIYHQNPELFDWVIQQLTQLNNHLRDGLFHVAYRVRDEVCIFVHHAMAAGWSREQALDYQVSMKILPRVQGSSSVVGKVLIGLWNWAVPTHPMSLDEFDTGDPELAVPGDAKYPRSAERIAQMLTRLRYDGYTSYWV